MVTIPIKARLEPDGTLDLHVSTGLPAADVDVLIVLQPITPPASVWPQGFFEQTYGACADQPLQRADQDAFDLRSALR